MKASILFSTILTIFLFSVTAQAKIKIPIEAGLWEMTDQITLNQKEIDEMMAQVPAEAQEQVKAMMKKQGLGSESAPYQDCVKKEDLEKGLFNQGKQCEIDQKSHKGNKYVFSISCNDPKGTGTMEMTIPNKKSYTSKVQMKVTEDGNSKEIKIDSKGKWLGPNCPK